VSYEDHRQPVAYYQYVIPNPVCDVTERHLLAEAKAKVLALVRDIPAVTIVLMF